jgi:hypothetical protein
MRIRLGQGATMFVVWMSSMFWVPHAAAFLPGARWEFGVVDYKINADSMVSHLNNANLALSASDWRGIVALAVNVWTTESGADITANYTGTSTDACETANGVNVVGGSAGCLGNDCMMNPAFRGWCTISNVGGFRVETDICLYARNQPSTFETEMDEIVLNGRVDAVGLLVHEFGHSFGLSHSNPEPGSVVGVMNAALLPNGRSRNLYGDDIEGMLSQYGRRALSERWAEYETEAMGAAFTKPGTIAIRPAGAIIHDGGYYVARAAQSQSNDRVWVDTAPYRLSSPSWTAYNSTLGASWFPPAITGSEPNRSPELVLATVPKVAFGDTCSTLRLFTSNDRFASAATAVVTDVCTNAGVALSFEQNNNAFILAYIAQSTSWPHLEQNEIRIRRSADGLTWSSANELATGLFSAGSYVGVACDNSVCNLTYVCGTTDYPFVCSTSISVGSGTMALGSTSSSSNFNDGAPVGVNSFGSHFQILGFHASIDDAMSGLTSLYSRTTAGVPITDLSWLSLSDTTLTTPALAASSMRAYSYLFWAE